MKKLLAGMAALGLMASPALAAPSNEPVKLTEDQLANVTAGQSLVNLDSYVDITLRDITLSLNVSNVPVNVGAAVQLNALGSAEQLASVTAYQQVTQVYGSAL
jgi:hypothetical protein